MPSPARLLVVAIAAATLGGALAGARAETTPAVPPVHPTDKAAGAISGGVPAMGGITPSRAELPASAFTKLDARQRGFLTREDVAQLQGFEAAFRAGDRNGDGRLTPAEFDAAWNVYGGLPK